MPMSRMRGSFRSARPGEKPRESSLTSSVEFINRWLKDLVGAVYSASSCVRRACHSGWSEACACTRLVPGFSRPINVSQTERRFVKLCRCTVEGSAISDMLIGRKMPGLYPPIAERKFCGATPITVNG